jgi:hypothetical protein
MVQEREKQKNQDEKISCGLGAGELSLQKIKL